MSSLFIHPPFWFALLFALGVGALAWSARWLTQGGALAATLVGLLVFWLGGGEATIPLLAFFVSSSIVSVIGRYGGSRRTQSANHGGPRTAAQVAANGGAAVILVVAHRVLAYHLPLEVNRNVQILFLAALATVNADTWATEFGTRWGSMPRQLSTWRTVPSGTSGAISVVGTLAAGAGALFIPLCTYRLWGLTSAELVCVTWAAFLGSLFDSILGAGLQAQYRSPVTNVVTDYAETGGNKNMLIHGLPWVDNNVVNFVASVAGALFCWVLLHYGLRNVL